MMSDLPAIAVECAQLAFETRRGEPLARAVREFVPVLRSSPAALQVLRHLAERVIVQIEQQVAVGRDRATTQRDLVEFVDAIRGALEAIDHWQQHYAARLQGREWRLEPVRYQLRRRPALPELRAMRSP
jgi:hypothetical protein